MSPVVADPLDPADVPEWIATFERETAGGVPVPFTFFPAAIGIAAPRPRRLRVLWDHPRSIDAGLALIALGVIALLLVLNR